MGPLVLPKPTLLFDRNNQHLLEFAANETHISAMIIRGLDE